MDRIPPPPKFENASNAAEQWRTFKQAFTLYLKATDAAGASSERQVALLLTVGGPSLLDIYNTLDFGECTEARPHPEFDFDHVVKLLDAHFLPKQNEVYSRYIFRTRVQLPDERFDTFLTDLKLKTRDCNFGPEKEKMIRDQIVCGVNDEKARADILKLDEPSLGKVVKVCLAHESTKLQLKVFKEGRPATEEVHAVKDRRRRLPPVDRAKDKKTSSNQAVQHCKYCGSDHARARNACPAWNKTCNKCKKQNHFAVVCKNSKTVASLEPEDDTDEILMVQSGKPSPLFATLNLNQEGIRFQVDSGAAVNVITKRNVSPDQIMPTSTTLRMWNGTKVVPYGKARLNVTTANGHKHIVDFVVVRDDLRPLIGRKTAEQMGLITVNYSLVASISAAGAQGALEQIMERHSDVFGQSLGSLPGLVHLVTKPAASPKAVTGCRVPVSVKPQLEKTIRNLEQRGIIKSVTEPTPWVSRMVVATKKNGDMRICIDPQALNEALERERHPLPILDDILPEVAKAKIFSKLDLRDGYWQCILDEESSLLTTFQTPMGRYRWLRLPFGLAVSSEIFQKRLQSALDGLSGVLCVADDILVYGIGETDAEARSDHDKKLENLLQRCQKIGVRLNRDKTELHRTSTTFLGHLLTKDGLRVDPEKVRAIQEMPPPTDVQGVQRFCGMVNYLARFLPKLSQVTEPLRKLVINSEPWAWSDEQDNAFQETKNLVARAPVLAYYNPQKPLMVQCDASERGLGAALLQDGQPLSFASRALTPTEVRYAQIEKEMLAIVFSLNKFHQYTFGRLTTVITDHKPLQAIMKKQLDQVPRRLQGMILQTQRYNIDLQYRPGKELLLADTMSRAFLPDDHCEQQLEDINVVNHLPVRKDTAEKIRNATLRDETLQKLTAVILTGWPQERHNVAPEIRMYFPFRDELVVEDDIVYKGQRLVIPKALRGEIKEKLHSSHMGIESTLRRARDSIFWPSMNAEIKDHISACNVCQKHAPAQQRETLKPHPRPDFPWERVGCDILEHKNKHFLVTVDYYSNFWEVDQLNSLTSAHVIRRLKAHFARHGIPSVLITDNGSQFACEAFNKFSIDWNFEHVTSSPRYPRSNGMAESAVKTVKMLLKKADESNGDPQMAFLDHRNTPLQHMHASPAQLLMGRRTRTCVPTTTKQLLPKTVSARNQLEQKKRRMVFYHDKQAKDLHPLSMGQDVMVLPTKEALWTKGTIKEQCGDRSYKVQVSDGVLRRNRVHIRDVPSCQQAEADVPTTTQDDRGHHRTPQVKSSPQREPDTTPVPETYEPDHQFAPIHTPTRPKRTAALPKKFQDFIVG
ncbi:uncharacterized protein K02A2.6-like [Ixodes scapularis]|uniref:uncharacterized protein K02A2.6-like n=1 Tax=Ixodes scapularis TaxID=6945 RepID=UPI001AD74250|nr:uncharacterized protein K02A2.6-like [Ixodes scapularis]